MRFLFTGYAWDVGLRAVSGPCGHKRFSIKINKILKTLGLSPPAKMTNSVPGHHVFNHLQAFKLNQDPCVPKTKPVGVRLSAPPLFTI
jgi:hypothetical protein